MGTEAPGQTKLTAIATSERLGFTRSKNYPEFATKGGFIIEYRPDGLVDVLIESPLDGYGVYAWIEGTMTSLPGYLEKHQDHRPIEEKLKAFGMHEYPGAKGVFHFEKQATERALVFVHDGKIEKMYSSPTHELLGVHGVELLAYHDEVSNVEQLDIGAILNPEIHSVEVRAGRAKFKITTEKIGEGTLSLLGDIKDYSTESLKITKSNPKEDPRTKFVTDGVNSSTVIEGLTEINGIPISALERNMRPGSMATEGFLGVSDGLLETLKEDNDLVRNELGLTHQQIAEHLERITSVYQRTGGFDHYMTFRHGGNGIEMTYHGVQFSLYIDEYMGDQESPFKDGDLGSANFKLVNHENNAEIKFSQLHPTMIRRYGFYEGKGTSYRLDPQDVVKVFSFLGKKK